MKVVECSNLCKSYKTQNAINKLSFEIHENRITGLIGRNGAGKTTLLKLIAGFLKPTEGRVAVFAQNPFDNLSVSSNMIFIDDNMLFPTSLSLAEILEAVGSFYKNWDHELAKRLLDYFSLNPRQSHNRLSKGTRSTFNAVVGLAAHCPLTIFDEPTTGMDSAVRKDFYRALIKDYINYPRTIILSSHLLSEIEDLLEDVLLLKDGTKCLHLPMLELQEYSIGIRGISDMIDKYIDETQVLYRENFAKNSAYVVIRNNLLESKLQQLKAAGLEISGVSAEDLCVYLTARTKGGIEDAFTRS